MGWPAVAPPRVPRSADHSERSTSYATPPMAVASPPDRPTEPQVRLLYAELLAALKLQLDEIDTVERKATFLLAPIAAALGLGVNAIGKLGPSMWAQGVFNVGLITLVAALFASVGAIWLTDVWSVPGGEGIWPDYATSDPVTYLIDACATAAEMWERNRDLQRARSKETWLKVQVTLLTAGVTMLTIGYAFKVMGGIP